ncbi:oxidoreductase [Paenibacillus baekrokdamisoli]|uniref:Oxidoreductase n=1 Tax=Paenibacillus baekrokdamisoli TaxID=1712516 RepID=A0A3G9JFS4_9BACL|nr:Gfo/Idh/MocA family oxidoreductase [Paenibacillus baekrokdamisoli]MBB3072938.1 putative dehydrogenase [Paenibacillus baekrokdamisoli]BBH22014.1 oxidoreductase [Paenibacillus baekrokdamisoli]
MDKIRIGMIGTGGIAGWHAQQLLELPEVEITAVTDTSAVNRASFVEKYGLSEAKQFTDYKAMLEEADLDAVVICSPHTLHFQQATDVLNKGLHVLIEKPMTCSSAEAELLIRTAEQSGKIMQVSYQRHFQPEFLYIRDAIASGAIGKLTSVTASLYQEWRQGTPGSWRQDPALSGGGFLMDSGSHIIDVLLWTTGLTPVEVKPQLHKHGAPVEIDTFTSIRFAEGAIAGLNLVGYAPCWHETFVFCGEDGGIFYDNGKITLRRLGQESIVPELPEQITNQDKSFIDAILGRHEVLVPGEFALKVVQLSEMIYLAAGYVPNASPEHEEEQTV